ncbi:MAG: hypothetical protein ACTHMX_13385 [Thermomicrobiales bacterium]
MKTTMRVAAGAGLAFVLGLTSVMGGSVAAGSRDDEQELGSWIYEGTCDALASSHLIEIGGLEVQDDDDDDIRDLDLPSPVPSPIWIEDEDFEGTYASLTRSPHAVVVRATESESSKVIACGEIVNVPAGSDPFTVDLLTVNDSGFMGVARFRAQTWGSFDEVDVTVGVWKGTSVATPAA